MNKAKFIIAGAVGALGIGIGAFVALAQSTLVSQMQPPPQPSFTQEQPGAFRSADGKVVPPAPLGNYREWVAAQRAGVPKPDLSKLRPMQANIQ